MEKLVFAVLGSLFGLGIIAGAWLYAILVGGFVLSHLWLWFLVPLGVPVITWVQAVGISTVVGYMTMNYGNILTKYVDIDGKKCEIKATTASTIVLLFAPWLTLLGGWIFKSLFM